MIIGTGKTLSMICSAFQWVFDQKRKEGVKEELECSEGKVNSTVGLDDEPDWIKNFVVSTDN